MRPIDADALRLMKVAECAGHTIEFAAGWEACVEYCKNDVPTIKAVTEEQYNAAVVKLLNDLRTRACSTGPISTADRGVLLLLDALMKCLLKNELFGGKENE